MSKRTNPKVTVRIDTDERGNGYTRGEWDAQEHRRIELVFNLTTDTPGYTHQEVRRLTDWYAGVMSRAIVWFLHDFALWAESHHRQHRCESDHEMGPCGIWVAEGITDECQPYVVVYVPSDVAKSCVEALTHQITSMLTSAQPAPPTTASPAEPTRPSTRKEPRP